MEARQKMRTNTTDYWNKNYWQRLLNKTNVEKDFLADNWLLNYQAILDKIPRGPMLDLGSGLGQFIDFFQTAGFTVTAADISLPILQTSLQQHPKIHIKQLDMSQLLPFADKSFNLVFANLAIHYFDQATTEQLLNEIKRILIPGGYFIGAVTSSQAKKYFKAGEYQEIEPNFYFESGRYARLFTREQFTQFFKDFNLLVLNETSTIRWGKTKEYWEFIAQAK